MTNEEALEGMEPMPALDLNEGLVDEPEADEQDVPAVPDDTPDDDDEPEPTKAD